MFRMKKEDGSEGLERKMTDRMSPLLSGVVTRMDTP
jgi:hypothetical protein